MFLRVSDPHRPCDRCRRDIPFCVATRHRTLWSSCSLGSAGEMGPKRKVTPEQFADELEPHLLGTGGAWHWDDVTSVGIDDKRLERLRAKLAKFDNLILEERRIEFTQIIAALRRGEVPDVKDD